MMNTLTNSRKIIVKSFLIIVTWLLFSQAAQANEHWQNDVAYFENNRAIYVYVDWQSFINQGIPASQFESFSYLSRAAIKRWNEIGGANVQMQWKGRRDGQDSPKSGSEIVLRMKRCISFSGEEQNTAVATASSAKGRGASITFYREQGSDKSGVGCNGGERINWHFGWSTSRADDQVGAHYVLVHELGHALGLKSHTSTKVTRYSVMSTDGYAMWSQRFGPWNDDINRLQKLYGHRIGTTQIHVKKSMDYGYSWRVLELLDMDKFFTTTQPMGVAKTGSNFVAAYTIPVWGFLKTIYGNEASGFKDGSVLWNSSARGVSVSANGNTTMMAYVDAMGDTVPDGDDYNYQIRLLSSNDLGKKWSKVNLPASHSAETPTIKYFGDNVWVLAYSLFGNSKQTQRASLPPIFPVFPGLPMSNTRNNTPSYLSQFGRLIVRVSVDNGNTWSQELTPDATGKWSPLLNASKEFASDPGWRVVSEIGVTNANGILIVQASTARTSERFSSQHYKIGGVTGSSAQLIANENLYSSHGPVLSMGNNILLQAHTSDYVTKTRVSAWNGGTGEWRSASMSTQNPAIEVDPYNNQIYMFTAENPWLSANIFDIPDF
ncbi:MAG: matrixin family metalloprotease [Gammaproteobacteria bacterium]|nr:matrixin family metalloprotease [Gammaproteobacteria bacterium]